jgi:gamma-carbonic anhydrase
MLYSIRNKVPVIGQNCYIAPTAVIVGDVVIGDHCTIFDYVVIEGDAAPVRIGNYVAIQSLSAVHAVHDRGTVIEDYVVVGHRSIVHAAHVEECATIGMGAVLSSYTRIGRGALIAEGCVVNSHASIPPLVLAGGVPASVIKPLSGNPCETAREIARYYAAVGKERREELREVPFPVTP